MLHTREVQDAPSRDHSQLKPVFNPLELLKSGNPTHTEKSLAHLPNFELFNHTHNPGAHDRQDGPLPGLAKQGFERKPADGGDTAEEKLKAKIVDRLKPDEKKAYESEEKQLADYRKSMADWEKRDMFGSHAPEAPKTPEHDKVDRQTKQMERIFAGDVRDGMTPAEREQLKAEKQKYENPGPVPKIFDPSYQAPQPGEAIKAYWAKLSAAVDKF